MTDRHITLPRSDRMGFVDTIPVNPKTPGPFTGMSRPAFMQAIFSLATTYGFDIRVAGLNWPEVNSTAEVHRLASDKLGKGRRRR